MCVAALILPRFSLFGNYVRFPSLMSNSPSNDSANECCSRSSSNFISALHVYSSSNPWFAPLCNMCSFRCKLTYSANFDPLHTHNAHAAITICGVLSHSGCHSAMSICRHVPHTTVQNHIHLSNPMDSRKVSSLGLWNTSSRCLSEDIPLPRCRTTSPY